MGEPGNSLDYVQIAQRIKWVVTWIYISLSKLDSV